MGIDLEGGLIVQLSREAKIVSGLTVLTVPTIMYGGITLLGILTRGSAGLAPGGLELNKTQWALWCAGHAHAGVWVILSLILQVLIDATEWFGGMMWTARISAPLAAVATSGGFFGLAFIPAFRWLVYVGVVSLAISLLLTGVGLLMNLGAPGNRTTT